MLSKKLVDQYEASVSDGVASNVDFFQFWVDDSLKECANAFGHQLIVLHVDPAQILIRLEILSDGGANWRFNEILSKVQWLQIQSIKENVLCALGLDQILRYFELFQKFIFLQRDGNDFRSINPDIIVL